MLRNRKTAGGVAVILVGTVALWIAWPRHEPVAEQGARVDAVHPTAAAEFAARRAVADAKPVPADPQARVVQNTPSTFRPMPPLDAPMRLVYRQIKEQADAGDPIAQCRLAHELLRCSRLPQEIETSQEAQARFKDRPDGARILDMIGQQLTTDKAVCQDFTPDAGDEPWRLMLRAALDGNHAAALQFVVSPPLDRMRPVADLEPNDPVQFAAYYLALMPLATPSYRTFLQGQVQSFHLGDADLAQAQTRAASLASSLKPPPDGQPVVGNNIVGYGRWNDGAECEH